MRVMRARDKNPRLFPALFLEARLSVIVRFPGKINRLIERLKYANAGLTTTAREKNRT